MGATQANTKGVGTLSWHHPGGSYFSPQGQLDPERDSLCPSGGQHTTTPGTQLATALNTDRHPSLGAQKEAPNHRAALVHRWPQAGRDATWIRLG